MTCVQVKDGKRDNRWISFFVVMACMFASSMTLAVELPDAIIDAAERVDRMGAMGILAFGFILSMAGLLYLIRLQYGKMMQVIDANTTALQRVADATEKCNNNR